MLYLSRFLILLAAFDACLVVYLIIGGLPAEVLGITIALKSIKKPFLGFLLLLLGSVLVDPRRKSIIQTLKDNAYRFAAWKWSIVILVAVYAVLFLWQQLTEYWTIDINFIPFAFYDFMLHYVTLGKVNYTGLLHGYYHLNNILVLLVPAWMVFKSSLFLIVIHGPIVALAAWPLYGIAKAKFDDKFIPLLIAFIYLNYRYLQNILLVNFVVEAFYPLFIFLAVYAALNRRWFLYYISFILGLLVKEDSFIYFSAVGVLLFFSKGIRRHGIITGILSILYFIFLLKIFTPLTGSDIFSADVKNYQGYGGSLGEILLNIASSPQLIFETLFGSPEKIRTLYKVTHYLLFLPFLSPTFLLVLIAIAPLFFQSSQGSAMHFVNLHFHYAAAVIPFIFISFIYGYSNLLRWVGERFRGWIIFGSSFILILLNGGNYVTRNISSEHLKSIKLAQSVPQESNLVTHGHLLPYIGYRKYNYYFAANWERTLNRPENPHYQEALQYDNADYYLIDFTINPYPMNRDYLEDKVNTLRERQEYELIQQDGERYLFKRRAAYE